MLRRLVQNERLRFWLFLVALLVGSAMFLVFAVGPLVSAQRWDKIPATLFCCLFPAAAFAVPWLIFAYRFVRLSSVRGITQGLSRYGKPDDVLARVDAELGDLAKASVLGQPTDAFASPQPDCLIMTENWLLRLCPGGSVVIHLPDLVWVHKRILAKSALLTLGRMEHELGCRMRNGDIWNFDTWTEGKTDQVLRELLERRPELLTGWRGDWLDLAAQGEAALWAEMQKRREQLAAMTPDQRDNWLDASWDDCQHFVFRVDRQVSAAAGK